MYESNPVRVLIADNDPLFRDGLKLIFARRPDLRVVGQASDGIEACETARRCEPDVVLIENRLPRLDGPAAVRRILSDLPRTRVAILSASRDESDILAAIKAGAHGYVTKDVSVGVLLHSVRRIARGDAVIPPSFASRLVQYYAELSRGRVDEPRPNDSRVTAREREILRLLVDGATNRDISRQLDIAENTVKVHLRNILEKLQLRNRQQAAAFAISSGLVRPWHDPADTGASAAQRVSLTRAPDSLRPVRARARG